MRPVPGLSMARRDVAGEFLEGDGTEDTLLDEDGDNIGDAGDEYRGSDRFGTTAAERSPRATPWTSGLPTKSRTPLTTTGADTPTEATVARSAILRSWSPGAKGHTRVPIRTSLALTSAVWACLHSALGYRTPREAHNDYINSHDAA